MKPNKYYIFLGFLFAALVFKAQTDGKLIYDGNKYYNSGKIPESSEYYRNAIKQNPHNAKAHFNLGNSIYKYAFTIKGSKESFIQGGKKVTADSLAMLAFGEAAQSFAQVANSVSNKDTLHRAWHNIGNCYMHQKEWQNAVDAYKKSLKFNPKDEDTRYNLAYALKNIPKDKKGGGGSGSPKEEDPKDPKKNSQPKSDMNKDQAEQMLKALMRDEKKLQEKRKQKQEDPANTTVEKDW